MTLFSFSSIFKAQVLLNAEGIGKSKNISDSVYNVKINVTHTHTCLTNLRVKIVERKDLNHTGNNFCTYTYLNTEDETMETC